MAGDDFGDLFTDVVSYDRDVVRNVYGARAPRDLFDDLSDDARDWAIAAAAEARAKPPSAEPFVTRPFDYGLVVAGPFARESWHSTRFGDGTRFGVWYGSEATRTPVKLGRSSVNTVEIVDGLNEGDQVILSDMSAWDAFERVRLN